MDNRGNTKKTEKTLLFFFLISAYLFHLVVVTPLSRETTIRGGSHFFFRAPFTWQSIFTVSSWQLVANQLISLSRYTCKQMYTFYWE